jgi:hypothetical protein
MEQLRTITIYDAVAAWNPNPNIFATHGDGRLKKLIKVNLIKIFFRNALDY